MTNWIERLRSGAVREAALVAALSLVGSTLFVWWTRGFTPDDAYITFRYAENLANGDGWTYNVGRGSANGATSPLYVLVLAAMQLVHAGPEANANVVTIVATTVAATCGFVLLGRLVSRPAGVLAAGLVVFNPWFPLSRSMESALLLALASAVLAVAFLAPVQRRGTAVGLGVLMGLTVLTRAEAVLLVVLLVGYLVWRDRRVPWVVLGAGAAVLVAWSLSAWVLIGSPVPATLGAKMAQARSGYWGSSTQFLTAWRGPLGGLGLWPWFVAVAAGAALAALAAWQRPAVRPLVVVLAGWAAATLVAVGLVIRVPAYFWYYAPVVLCLLLLAAVGWGHLLAALPSPTWRAVPAVLAVVVVAAFVLDRSPRGFQHGDYGDAAGWIVAHTEPGGTVAAAEIGVVGFRTDRPVVDFLGLLDTRAAEDLERGDLRSWLYRDPPEVFLTHDPAWVFEIGALAAPGFAQAYTLEAGDRGLWVFEQQRPLDPERADEVPIVAPDRFLDALRSAAVVTGPGDGDAVEELVAVLVARPDLQQAFLHEEAVDVPALLGWARDVSGGTVGDRSQAGLAPSADAFAAMAERALDAGLGRVRFADPFVDDTP